jgi:hypothetical protein
MKFLRHNISHSDRWENYKQLELIPDRICKPNTNKFRFLFGLGSAWHILLSLLIAELIEEQRVEYLERCWKINESKSNSENKTNFFRKLWTLMD